MNEELYTAEWQERHDWTRDPARRCLREQFRLLGRPASYLDVGCGPGVLVVEASTLGVGLAAGLDMAATLPGTSRVDLTGRWNLDGRYEQVTCWEVAEHLPQDAAASFVLQLAKHVGGYLVFTAAPPGQGGEGHVNEQPPEYWRAALEAAGLHYMATATTKLAQRWTPVCGPCWWYPRNVQVFAA